MLLVMMATMVMPNMLIEVLVMATWYGNTVIMIVTVSTASIVVVIVLLISIDDTSENSHDGNSGADVDGGDSAHGDDRHIVDTSNGNDWYFAPM